MKCRTLISIWVNNYIDTKGRFFENEKEMQKLVAYLLKQGDMLMNED